jgi:membrane-associated phospholipid phosphatase
MKKAFGPIKVYMSAIAGLLAIIGIIIGSFLDKQIATALYNGIGNNWWSTVVEYAGTLPTAVIIGGSSLLLFFYFKDRPEMKHSKLFMYLFPILIILIAGIYYGFDTFHRHKELGALAKAYVYMPLGIVAVALLEIPVYFFMRNGDSNDYLRKALIMIIALLVITAVTFGIKYLNSRPRYMWIAEIDRLDLYRDWFQFQVGKSMYKELPGYASFNIQSWPSGHASFSSLSTLIICYAACNKKTQGKELFFFIGACVWSMLVMMARLFDGHHYLSDVSWGFLFTIGFSLLIFFIAYKDRKHKGANKQDEGLQQD